MESWRTWYPQNEYEFYTFEICKLYIAGIISTEECNRRLEQAKDIFDIK